MRCAYTVRATYNKRNTITTLLFLLSISHNMPVPWFEGVRDQIANGAIDPWNTKEDAEVLFGLTIGTMVYEELFDFHIAKQNRIVQAIG